MFDQTSVDYAKEKLNSEGCVHIPDAKGRMLYLINSRLLRLDFPGLVAAYEGYGTATIRLDRPLNQFLLLQGGFPMQVCGSLSDFINRVTGVTEIQKVIPVANQLKALPAPKPVKKSRSGTVKPIGPKVKKEV